MSPGEPERPIFVLLTCEHAGRDVPDAYATLFRGRDAALNSHRGVDIGALGVALRMAARLSAPIIFSTVTRLLIDLNRSIDQPDAYSEFSADLPEHDRRRIADLFYYPHRNAVTRTIECATASGHRVLHLGIHSCTDILDGTQRNLDIALLFDESRAGESVFARHYRASMVAHHSDLRYRFNEPYNGADDGLTTTLRGIFPQESYLGIEIEVRQGLILNDSEQRAVGDLLATSLMDMLRKDSEAR